MLVDQVSDYTFVVFLDEKAKNKLFSIAFSIDEAPPFVIEYLLEEGFQVWTEQIRNLPKNAPLSPGMPGFEDDLAKRAAQKARDQDSCSNDLG